MSIHCLRWRDCPECMTPHLMDGTEPRCDCCQSYHDHETETAARLDAADDLRDASLRRAGYVRDEEDA